MGATGWKYFVPYQADTLAALQQLRKRVFAEGRYSGSPAVSIADYEAALKIVGSNRQSDLNYFASQAADPSLPMQVRNKFAVLVQQLSDSKASSPKPKTIEELLKKRGETGTHSILDIIRISEAPEFGAIHRLPVNSLAKIFGPEKPSRALIETKYEEGAFEKYARERWQGFFVVAYRDDIRDEICFIGCSGD